MPLNYNPDDAVTCWPAIGADGKAIEYDAVLQKVEDSVSKSSGNPMQVWTFEVYDRNNRMQFVTEYVVIPAATFKVKQLARALGREREFKAKTFQAEDHLNSRIAVNLIVDQQDGFDDKNKIGRYIAAPAAVGVAPNMRIPQRQPAQPVGAPFGDEQQFKGDDIPF